LPLDPVRRVGRPVDVEKLAALVDASWDLFLERGVEAVTLESIAAKAGVSKATLYKHFADKTALFQAGVLRAMEQIEASQQTRGGPQPESLRELLQLFGEGIMGFNFSDPAIAFYTSLAGDLSRHPDLARRFYETGPGRTKTNLARVLEHAAAAKQLDVTDPNEAAEHLFGLWQGFANFQLSLAGSPEHLRAHLSQRVSRAIDVFLLAYAPPAASE